MNNILPIILAVLIILVFVSVLLIFAGKNKKPKGGHKAHNRSAIIRDATRKLSQNPHNPAALQELSSLYFQENNWEKALPLLDRLFALSGTNKNIDHFQTSLRYGICALKQHRLEDAKKGLLAAANIDRSHFEVNYNLGQAYFLSKEYEQAVPHLKVALANNPDAPKLNEFLGLALYNLKRYRDALSYLRRALDENPEEKSVLFAMADGMQQTGFGDKALKVFVHLRADPEYGGKSCLAAGVMHMNNGELDKAMQDFEIALRHTTIPTDTLLEIKYRLAGCYLQTGDMDRGLNLLKDIQSLNPNYRDVTPLITRYTELKQNKNLQIYLTAGSSDFAALCRKLVENFYGRATVRIMDVVVTSEHLEILAEVETVKWEDTVIFRFYRTSGTIGELHIREFHSRIRDAHVGQGVCFTAGTYSDEARKFIEGRPIDLVDKNELTKRLKKLM